MSQVIDWDALIGYRGELQRPVSFEGQRFTHATIKSEDPRAGQWVLELQPAQYVPCDPAWWAENRPGYAVPQDQPSVGEVEGRRVLVTEWRWPLQMRVDGYGLLRSQIVFKALPMREVEDMPTDAAGMQALIEQLVTTERSD